MPITSPMKTLRNTLKSTTLRGFSGGLNVIDDALNLSYKFSVLLTNMYVAPDGSINVRYGTKLFANCAAHFSTASVRIVNIEYFNASLIVVGSNGEILRILGDGTISRIWDSTIAAALPDAPAGWSATDFASFAQFNGHLIICNGVDKPLDIDSNFVVEYLQDAATNTNINVPICRYVIANQRYLVMAGDPVNPDRVHISARDAHGTWFGDPPPNDATRIDVGSVMSIANTVRGLMPFRDKLLVLFAEGIVIGTLGIYNDEGSHTPNFDDAIEGYGSISHRATLASGDDGLMCDLTGVPSVKRTLLSTSLKPERVSDLVDPLITEAINQLTLVALEDRVFSVYDRREGQYMLFVPNAETVADTTETTAFVYSYRPALKLEAWSVYEGWNFTCGCRSIQGNVFFGDAEGKIWLLGSRDNVVTADYVDTISPTGSNNPQGEEIAFEWLLPWIDLGARDKSKSSKYIAFDTRGEAEFTCEMFCDEFSEPALTTQFSGGSQGGFGDGAQTYGGGRRTSYRKLYAWPAKFQLAQLKITGSTREALRFVSVTMKYLMGGVRP